ncbi:CTTNBP2 N-terminal-like protein-like [Scleropages formosus]|uniref:CTTNBP2 N-terminal-like protein-like n=1 Tax=Scleropages formosus TaxID=113540 RepID=A0A0P7U4Z8_SCLFO|nr:CTTNBP2 N-terminal-like protein-like [Scleropages formosus]
MEDSRMDVENLSKAELLTLFSVLEGELEARDLVIEALRSALQVTSQRYQDVVANLQPLLPCQSRSVRFGRDSRSKEAEQAFSEALESHLAPGVQWGYKSVELELGGGTANGKRKETEGRLPDKKGRYSRKDGSQWCVMGQKGEEPAQQRDTFVQERYGRYRLSDPFLALQRDGEVARGLSKGDGTPPGSASCLAPSPLTVLQLVVAHCKKMQQKTMAQLAAAEKRHRKVIADLEEEKRRHAQDTAEGDDVTYMLEKERERLLQQVVLPLCFSAISEGFLAWDCWIELVEEAQAQNEQLSSSLAQECQRAAAQAQEEGRCMAALQAQLEAEQTRASRAEERLRLEQGHCRELRAQLEDVRKDLAEKVAAPSVSAATQTEPGERLPARSKVNGIHHGLKEGEAAMTVAPERPSPEHNQENGGVQSPVHPHASLSPSSTASSSLTSSPCSSPVLAKRLGGSGALSPSYQSSYQSSVTQRFQAARHKFQTQAEQDQMCGPASPHDLSPTTAAADSAKQLARNTVTHVLSRFTGQQGAANLACLSPSAKPSSPLSPGGKSSTVSRGTHPPPIPPKKLSASQSPASPGTPTRSSHFPELSGGCGLTSTQEGCKELDMVVSSSS